MSRELLRISFDETAQRDRRSWLIINPNRLRKHAGGWGRLLSIRETIWFISAELLLGQWIARHRIRSGAGTAADRFIFAYPTFSFQISVVTELAEERTVAVERDQGGSLDIPRADRHKAAGGNGRSHRWMRCTTRGSSGEP